MVLSAWASVRSTVLASPGKALEPHPAHEERDAFTPDVESATKHELRMDAPDAVGAA
jgi:hypothetical protein